MKRILAAVVAVALVFAMAACSDKGGGSKEEGPVTLTAAQATAEMERSVASVRTADKAEITMTYGETEQKAGVVESKSVSVVKFLFDGTKYLMEYKPSYYRAEDGGEIDAPILVSRFYAEPAAAAGKYNLYDVSYTEAGEIDAAASVSYETTETFAKASMYAFIAGGDYMEYSFMPLAFFNTVPLSKAVREAGATTIDEQAKNPFMGKLMYIDNLLFDVKGKIEKSGEGELTATCTAKSESDPAKETTIFVGVKVKHAAQLPAMDVSGIEKGEMRETESVFLADYLGELTELYDGSELTDGTHTSGYAFYYAGDCHWRIYGAEKATVYIRYLYKGSTYKTYYDFTDSAKQDVYYNADYDPAQEDIGVLIEKGQENEIVLGSAISFDLEKGIVTMTKGSDKFEMHLSGMGLPVQFVTVKGGKTYTETFKFDTKLKIPTDEFLQGFTLKEAAAA